MKLATNLKVYAAKSYNFVSFEFNCTSDWDDMIKKVLIFGDFENDTDESGNTPYYKELDENNRVFLPHGLKPGLCHMLLFGVKPKDKVDMIKKFDTIIQHAYSIENDGRLLFLFRFIFS